MGPVFERLSTYLGDQWRVGDWAGFAGGAGRPEPPQNLREYDPEWARAFVEGTVAASCPHDRMLAAARVPMLLTHHMRSVDEATGTLMGALTDLQARRAGELVKGAGQPFDYLSLPDAAHAMHSAQPERFATVIGDWAKALPGRGARRGAELR